MIARQLLITALERSDSAEQAGSDSKSKSASGRHCAGLKSKNMMARVCSIFRLLRRVCGSEARRRERSSAPNQAFNCTCSRLPHLSSGAE